MRQIGSVIVISLLILGLGPTFTVQGAPPRQGTRPELPEKPIPGGDNGGSGGSAPRGGIYGTVINWSFRNEPGATVGLRGSSWELKTVTDDNGHYALQDIGEEICLLNPLLPEGSGLKSMTSDLALKVTDSSDLVVNLGIYSSQSAPTNLPVRQTMTVRPSTVMPGDKVVYDIKVSNKMPHGISQVIMTDYLPGELNLLEVTTSHGQVAVREGLVMAYIGEIAEGGEATVTITVGVAPGLHKGVVIENRASLIYKESVATQSTASITVGEVGEPKPPPSIAEKPEGEPRPTPSIAEKPEEEAKPKPDTLPETGLISLPLAGLGLAALLILSRKLRNKAGA